MNKNRVMQIMWHITDRCNLKCKHCYMGDTISKELSLSKLQYIVDQIAELHNYYYVIRIGILGGEPFMRTDLFDIVKYIYNKGIPRVDIATNATLISDSIIRQIKENNIASVQISMEGHAPFLNDAIRGKGTFNLVCKAIKKLRMSEIPLALLVTVSKINYKYIKDMVEFARSNGIEIISFNPFLPLGRGLKQMQDQVLSPSELYSVIQDLHKYNQKYKDIRITSDCPYFNVFSGERVHSKGGCGAGIANLAILEDGTVYPCRRLPIPIGNVFTSTLSQIMLNNDLLKLLRTRKLLFGLCQFCKHRNICGGCRASAWLFKHNLMESDPLCIFVSKYEEKRRYE